MRRKYTLGEFTGPLSSPPNIHALIVVAVASVMLVAWMSSPTGEQQANAAVVASLAPEVVAEETPPPLPPPEPAPPARDLTIVSVRPDDSLTRIFKRLGLHSRDVPLVTASGPFGSRLEMIFPGQELAFERDAEGNLVYLRYKPGKRETIEFTRVGDGFEASRSVMEPDRVRAYKHAVIESSLFIACQRVDLTDAVAIELAEIFQWDIDFILDIRVGDEFHLLYEELHIDGKRDGFGDILAAEMINQGESYAAVRYEDDAGRVGYFTPSGRNMRKAFLRAPLDFTRISSNFNLRRVHPLWKSIRPHRGIDYAAPTGTKVMAAGEGRVIAAGRHEANGNYVVLRHGARYSTKYLHLSRIEPGIKAGKRVEQGEVIGRVGATGWATGPHLHYEFLVDNVHQNPRTVSLPDGLPVGEDERPAFDGTAALLLADLKQHKTRRQVAYANAAQ